MHFESAKLKKKRSSLPLVSVFVAARNEEKNLLICLSALQNQDYEGFFEVWVGDDQSTDGTLELATRFSISDDRFQVISVKDAKGKVHGKANVLGQLAEKAKGEVFLFCDADMEMPPTWMETMVETMYLAQVDMVNGTTATKGDDWFSALQAIDWLLPQGTFAWMSQLGITYTAMGNNMGISRKAYEATGGYLNLPFSLTEDFELFKHAREKGYQLIHLFHPKVFGISTPLVSPFDWLEQHVRWMVGFHQLPFRQKLVFYLQLLFYPLFFLSFFLPFPGISHLFLFLFLCQFFYFSFLLAKIKQYKLLIWLPLYLVVFWPSYIFCWLKFIFQNQVNWKGRTWKLE
jgi:cellulose synthase/poly-beta-1,6-N-acetylglucosamine synthase-like glycosyltransferase